MHDSIVIRVKNEAEHLGSVLEALGGQEQPCLEVIVVDSGSTDGTVQIAERFGARIIAIEPQSFTFGYALNVGVAASRGEVAAFLSGHARPCDQRWLAGLVAPFRD